MRIAYLADRTTGNGFYRGTGPMAALAQARGHAVRQLSNDEDRPPLADVRDIDVLYVHRYCDARTLRLVREAKAHGAAIVWDNDDDITAVPKESAAYRSFGGIHGHRRVAEMKKVFALADLVTSPSRRLSQQLAALGAAHTDVIENHVPEAFLEHDRRPHGGVTIGWIAGLEHQLDVERIPIRDVLQRLLDERPDVSVVTFGLRLGLRSERYRAVDVVPLMRLCQEAACFDVGIAPIADIDLNRARSNIKLKEYAAAGAPWLASPIGPYADMGEQQGGRLVPDDGWHAAISRLLDKPRERRKLAKHAAKWVTGETLGRNAQGWEARFEAAIQRARAAA